MRNTSKMNLFLLKRIIIIRLRKIILWKILWTHVSYAMYNDFFAIFESLILTRAKMKQEDKSWAVKKKPCFGL